MAGAFERSEDAAPEPAATSPPAPLPFWYDEVCPHAELLHDDDFKPA